MVIAIQYGRVVEFMLTRLDLVLGFLVPCFAHSPCIVYRLLFDACMVVSFPASQRLSITTRGRFATCDSPTCHYPSSLIIPPSPSVVEHTEREGRTLIAVSRVFIQSAPLESDVPLVNAKQIFPTINCFYICVVLLLGGTEFPTRFWSAGKI